MKAFSILLSIILLYSFAGKEKHAFGVKNELAYDAQNLPIAMKDTFMVSGLTFRIIDYKSGRSLNASIKNHQIQILNQGVQYFQYRVVYYIFSSMDDENMPIIRHFDQRLSYPVLNALKKAAIGSQYIFEEIIVVDPSGIKLSNEVRSILIERVE